MPSQVWTRRVSVPWEVGTTYYQRQWDALTRVDDAGLLFGHRVVGDRIAMRLGDQQHVISFSSDYVDGAVLVPTGDVERVRNALEIVLEAIRPKQLLRPTFDFQWLDALETPYDEARLATATALFGTLDGAELNDWSATLDGRAVSPAGTMRAEFGVVEAAEAQVRLAREVGTQFLGPPDPDIPPGVWNVAELPDVAFFFDSQCRLSQDVGEPSVDALFDLWSAAEGPLQKLHDLASGSVKV